MRVITRKLGPCGDPPRTPPVNLGGPVRKDPHSGFLIVRLSARLKAIEASSLAELAEKLQLGGLTHVLKEFGLDKTRRVVRSLPVEKLLGLEARARQSRLKPLRSLTAYWRIDARARWAEADRMLERLAALPEVEHVYKELDTSDPVINDADDPYAAGQDHLDAAPTGIDARWAWTQPNGEGVGPAFVDLEQGWFLGHEDYASKAPTLIYGDNRDGVGAYKGNHGTAVLGEVAGDDNTRGVVGVAPSVTSVRVTSHYDAATDTALHVADALVAAAAAMQAGDVVLLEVQRNYLPTETDDADFDAIRLAVALGIVVVEAAGNGNADLDAYTDGGGDRVLNRTDATFRDSGAIMVGSSESAAPHNRYIGCGVGCGSNYGTRIDCYAYGENITTCGYGDLDPGTGDNSTYTDDFGGTSGASPIVTGAALILQGMYQATTGTRLSPGQMRALLSNPATGTAQGGGVAGNIGVMPDLRAIISDTLGLVPDVYVRDSVGDTGVIPHAGSISASPDVIVRPDPVADPVASFGEGSGTENSSTLGFEVEAGQDNVIYVRARNRGTSDATAVRATVYWSEVATLVTPDMWHLVGTAAPFDVPQGNTLAVSNAIVWAKDQIPGTGHYCFVALLDHAQDPAPPLPPSGPAFDWDAFRDFVRNHNNVTWRNFNVVDNLPDPAADPFPLPFVIAGAPDRRRRFDLEIVQHLPKGARVWLEVPIALAAAVVNDRPWETRYDRKRGVARVALPSARQIGLCDVALAAKGRYRSRLLVKTTKEMMRGGHAIAIRQLFDGEEVGRVTWQFAKRRRAPGVTAVVKPGRRR